MSNFVDFNENGIPMFAVGGNVQITTKGATGSKKQRVVNKASATDVVDSSKDSDFITRDNKLYAPWFGSQNDRPLLDNEYIQKSGVLWAGIDYKSRLAIGQGLYAVKVVGYDNDGNELTQPITDPYVNKFLRSRIIRKTVSDCYYSLYSHGMAFPQVVGSEGSGNPVLVKVHKSHQARLEKYNADNYSPSVGLSADWSSTSEKLIQIKAINTLLMSDAIIDAAKSEKNFIFPIGLPSPINLYYSDAPWSNAQRSGHLDISLKIAKYLDKMFDNQMSIKYHIQIPYAYWDKKYPDMEYPTPEDKQKRKAKIQADIDKIIENFTKAENAQKAIISHFEINAQGKAEEKWEISVIDDKFKNDQYLPHAASSNTEIFVAMGINPNIKGMSQAAGPYSNNQGGSNIREAFAVDVALSWQDTQEVTDFITLLFALQFPKYADAQLRTKQTVLTTLDTGTASKTVSQ